MTFGMFTCQIMADGKIEESRWAEPAVNHHLFHIYHLAPNTNILMFPNNMIKAQCWPGRHVGECIVQFYAYQDVPPTMDTLSKFKTTLDIVCLEDMPTVPKIHKNIEANPHHEMVFDRGEPFLIH